MNGAKTVDLGWLRHTGADVYWFDHSDDHRSYHKSGRVHSVRGGEKQDRHAGVPLAELAGVFHLTTIGFHGNDMAGWSDDVRVRGRESDPTIAFDTRALPADEWVQVSVALLEPHRYDVVDRLTRTLQQIGVDVRQIIVLPNVNPWVYVSLTVGFPDDETRSKQTGYSESEVHDLRGSRWNGRERPSAQRGVSRGIDPNLLGRFLRLLAH